MRRVLVTGAGGFIGRHTLRPLLAAGLQVHAVGRRQAPEELPPGVNWHRADMLAPDAVERLIDEVCPSDLLHLAWYTRPGAFWSAAENLDWVVASLGLLRAFGESGGRRAVLAGTCAEYDWQRHTHCVEEVGPGALEGVGVPHVTSAPLTAPAPLVTPIRPATLYGAAKHGLHVVARGWAAETGVALAWGRIFHLYGPHEHPARLVGGVARALVRGERGALHGGSSGARLPLRPRARRGFCGAAPLRRHGPPQYGVGRASAGSRRGGGHRRGGRAPGAGAPRGATHQSR